MVEGAPIRRAKPPHRLPAILNPPQAAPLPPDPPPAPTWKMSDDQASRTTFLPLDKENRNLGAVPKASRARRSRRGRGCVSHSEPRRKSQRLALVDNSAPLVPWNLSFTLSPPGRAPPGGGQSRLQPPGSLTSRSSLPQCAALDRKSRSTSTTANQALPSLPTMQVLSLGPNINYHP